MPPEIWYSVIEKYDESKHICNSRGRIKEFLGLLNKEDRFRSVTLAKKHLDWIVPEKVEGVNHDTVALNFVIRVLRVAKDLGIIKMEESKNYFNDNFMEEFRSVNEWANTLATTNFENLDSKRTGTRQNFVAKLRGFNNWVKGKSVTYLDPYISRDENGQVKEVSDTFENVEQMCNLLRKKRHIDREDFELIIEQYLDSPLHDGLSYSSKRLNKTAINSYFRYYKTKLQSTWLPRRNGKTKKISNKKSKKNKKGLKLSELAQMIQFGGGNVAEVGSIMIMFQRGLDESTMADRFNYQAWEILVDWFETEDWNKWDLTKIPVPIELERVKTDVDSYGFLEYDAVVCIQRILNNRYEKYGTKPKFNEPMILNNRGNGISPHFCANIVLKLAKNAQQQVKLISRTTRTGAVPNKITAHMLRHTIDTIIKNKISGTSLADSVINHAGTYDDSAEITPEILRAQYATLAPIVNIISKMNDNMNGEDPEKESMQLELQTLRNSRIDTEESMQIDKDMDAFNMQNIQSKMNAMQKRIDELESKKQ